MYLSTYQCIYMSTADPFIHPFYLLLYICVNNKSESKVTGSYIDVFQVQWV